MKRILNIVYTVVLVVLLSFQLFGQTVRYVDGSLTGTDNGGTSWADAWESLDEIEWGDLQGGGYLYISGGTDSTVYTEQLYVQTYGTSSQYVYIMAGKYAPNPTGHSGRVVLNTSSGASIQIDACNGNEYYDWIYIKGLESQRSNGEGVYLHCDVNNIVIDSVWIEDAAGQGIFINGNDDWSGLDTSYIIENVEIKNCTVISQRANLGVDDNIYAQKNSNLIIHHNFLHQRNQQTGDGTGDHIDNIQTANASSNLKIYNNICIVDSGVRGHAFILGQFAKTADYSDTVFVYNNFIRNGGHIVGDCYYQQVLFFRLSENFGAQPYVPLCYSVNNTVIVANRGTQNIVDGNPSYVSNTIILQYGEDGGTPGGGCALGMLSSNASNTGQRFWKYVDSCHTNLLWRAYSPYNAAFDGSNWRWGSTTGSISGWSDWISKGGDGVNEDPLMSYNFGNDNFDKTAWNTAIVEIESNSPAIDAGTDMSYLIEGKFGYLPDISTDDILGNPRDATWDIGAFEYTSGGWTPPDTIPSFSFTAVNNAELNTVYTASSTFTGADSTFTVYTTTGALFNINTNSSHTSTPKTATNGDVIYVQNLTGMSYSTAYTETIIAGGQPRNYVVTTKAYVPPSGNGGIVKGSNGIIWRDSLGRIIKVQP